jgi:FolB domain-containing protein
MDIIRIDGLEVDCIVGLHPAERRREQRISIDLALRLDLSKAGATGRIGDTWDYDEIADGVTELLRFREYALIEVAATEIAAMLLGLREGLDEINVRIDKPGALPGRAKAASIEITRDRSALDGKREDHGFGWTQLLHATRESSVCLAFVRPNREISVTALSPYAPALAWLVHGSLASPGRTLEKAGAHLGDERGWRNTGPTNAVVFYCEHHPIPRKPELVTPIRSGEN